MTDTGFYVPWRVGYNFQLAKLLEKPSGTLWWVSTLVSVERSYRNKLTLYLSQIKPHLIIISEISWEKSQKTVICSGFASLRQSLLSALIYNKTTIIQLHFCQIWSRSLILLSYWSPSKMTGRGKMAAFVNRSILKWLSLMTGHEF